MLDFLTNQWKYTCENRKIRVVFIAAEKNHTKLSDGEDFLYSIGNYEYSQYHIILGKGKNLKKDIYIYI